jgi:hypothetical protein
VPTPPSPTVAPTPPLEFIRSPRFSVHPCDGAAVAKLTSSTQTIFHVNFWADGPEDIAMLTPRAGLETPLPVIRTLLTSIRVTPDSAMQIALALLEALSTLPDDVKARYNIQDIRIQREAPQ